MASPWASYQDYFNEMQGLGSVPDFFNKGGKFYWKENPYGYVDPGGNRELSNLTGLGLYANEIAAAPSNYLKMLADRSNPSNKETAEELKNAERMARRGKGRAATYLSSPSATPGTLFKQTLV